MTVAVSALVLVTIFIFGWVSLGNVRRGYERAGEYQATLTQRVGADLDGKLQTALDALEATANTLTPASYAEPAAARRWLDLGANVKDTFFHAGLVLFDRDGRLLAASAATPSLAASDELRRWVALVRKLDEPLIGLPCRCGEAAGTAALLLPMAVPYHAPDGAVAGVLVGVSDLSRESMVGNALSTKLGKSGYFFMTAWDGNVLAHPDPQMVLQKARQPVPADMLQAATLGARGPLETVDDGGNAVLATFVKMQATGWVLGASHPTDDAYAQVHAQERDALIFMILGSIAIADATWFLMGMFIAPIRRLAGQIGAVDVTGDRVLDPVPVPRESAEVAQLARSFNELVTRLNDDREQSHIAGQVFLTVREGIVVTDRNGHIVSCNHAFEDITGYTAAEVRGRSCAILQSGRQDVYFYRQMWRSLTAEGAWRGELWNRRKNGELYPELLTVSAVHDEDGFVEYYVGIFSDITEQVEQQQRLERMATTDALTGLPNRALLADRLRQCLAQARRLGHLLAVAYVDLDGFKEVNDRAGHHLGDQLLIQAAERFSRVLRLGDTVARLGGDEFVLLLTDIADQTAALRILERVLAEIAAPYLVEGGEFRISASIGVTLFPHDDAEPEILMRHADHAMYQAKSSGRACIHVFDPQFDRDLQNRRELSDEIREAIRKGELLLHYQPKIDMRSRQVTGVEALLRWNHPDKGLLMPGHFIDEVAGTDVVIDIGQWVLTEACRQIDRWIVDSGLQVPVSINLAARHLTRDDFVSFVHETLCAHPRVPPECIEIEILESDVLQDLARIERAIRACQSLGIRFALDDFGTGYSSLSHLKNIPVDVLKIDRSFVSNMLTTVDDLAIVEGVVRLAGVFKRQVVAEGVETDAHMEALCSLGCYHGQGYGISRPVPPSQVIPWMVGCAERRGEIGRAVNA